MTAAIGTFDGVHKGHRELLKLADVAVVIKTGKEKLKNDKDREKSLLNYVGKVITYDLDNIKNWTCEEFYNKALKEFDRIVVGEDFRFGKDKSGGVKELKALCRDLTVIKTIEHNGKKISSTRIIDLLDKGEDIKELI